MRIAIQGLGRLGRAVFRKVQERSGLELVAVNDAGDGEALAYLLRHDSVRGRFPGRVELVDGCLATDHRTVPLSSVTGRSQLPWRRLGVDVVIASADTILPRGEAEAHLAAGALRVVMASPAMDPAGAPVALGVNHETVKPEHRVVTCAAGVAGCLAPLVAELDRAFGLEHGQVTAVRGYDADQALVDAPRDDLRRARAGALNLVPTCSEAARAVGQMIPHLAGRLEGLDLRTPVPGGSLVLLAATTTEQVTVLAAHDALRAAAAGPRLAGILAVAEDPVVSTDLIGDTRSCLFDPGCTGVVGGHLVRAAAWIDEDWAQAARICELLELMAGQRAAG